MSGRQQIACVLGGCFVYFIFPVDLVPDFIPVLGQLDDLAVVTWGVRKVRAIMKENESQLQLLKKVA